MHNHKQEKISVVWEWVYEPLDEHGDIIDPDHEDAGHLLKLMRRRDCEAVEHTYGVIRKWVSNLCGEEKREYFYPGDDGHLPSEVNEFRRAEWDNAMASVRPPKFRKPKTLTP